MSLGIVRLIIRLLLILWLLILLLLILLLLLLFVLKLILHNSESYYDVVYLIIVYIHEVTKLRKFCDLSRSKCVLYTGVC